MVMIALLGAVSLAACCAPASLVRPADFGAVGDGETDDGPAIQRSVAALLKLPSPRTLRFEPRRTYRILTSADTWLLRLDGMQGVTVEGQGATFVLHPRCRFLHAVGASDLAVSGVNVDFDPLPFADGTVVAADARAGTIDVRLAAGFPSPPLGGPTGEREQAYFAMLWHAGPHSLIGEHYFLKDTLAGPPGSERTIRAVAAPGFGGWAGIRLGETRISLPVRGIAHRMEGHGASPVFVIEETTNARFADVELWSAPLFAVNVARNRGRLVFRRFNIRPKPGTGRLTSSWRDGFHVKANRAALLWEDCILAGMNDDSFNTATHSSVVTAVDGAAVRIRQVFPLGFVPFDPGDRVCGYRVRSGELLSEARVVAASEETRVDHGDPDRPAPEVTLRLDRPAAGIEPGDILWNVSSANPDTTIRRCHVTNSCRFQSPVTIENCDISALSWFYGDNIEGPLPRRVVVRGSRLLLGRGNPTIVLAFACCMTDPAGRMTVPRSPVLRGVLLEDNIIDGVLDVSDAEDVMLRRNRFVAPRSQIRITRSRRVALDGNRLGDTPLDRVEQLTISDDATRGSIRFGTARPGGR